MPAMSREAWERLNAAHQDQMASLGIVPEPEPWMDEAYKSLTGRSPGGVSDRDAGNEDA